MITKTNMAVTYTAETASDAYKLTAEVKTNVDQTDVISVNGTIASVPDHAYTGSFSMIETSLSININNKDRNVFTEISTAVAAFIDSLTPLAE